MKKKILSFVVLSAALIVLVIFATGYGSIDVTYAELMKGLFGEVSNKAAIVYDLRVPRIFVAILGGAGLAAAGVLFQSVMKNPLADPGIIGVSSGAALASVIVLQIFPKLYFCMPVISFIGGLIAFMIVYSLCWKEGLNPLRIILTGIAVNAVFEALNEVFNSISGSNSTNIASLVNANISMKTWDDVFTLAVYVVIFLIAANIAAGKCNILALEDKTARGLGVDVNGGRLVISIIAVALASICTSIIGVISFLALIVPHIGRLIVGSDHKYLIPFSMILGSFTFLLADTIGRIVAAPNEISSSIVMAVIGGPFFIFLLRRSYKNESK